MTHFEHIENLLDRAIGFDKAFNRLHNIQEQQSGYPPYNIIKDGDERYAVEIAVAGFAKDEIDIELKEGNMLVTGKKSNPEVEKNFVHKGIGTRAFTRTFTLSDDVVVKGADLDNGILVIELERIIPEEKKPRKIEIGTVSEKQLLTEE
jgi:molecular chaperone IbpA